MYFGLSLFNAMIKIMAAAFVPSFSALQEKCSSLHHGATTSSCLVVGVMIAHRGAAAPVWPVPFLVIVKPDNNTTPAHNKTGLNGLDPFVVE